jgi:hypothetical protein
VVVAILVRAWDIHAASQPATAARAGCSHQRSRFRKSLYGSDKAQKKAGTRSPTAPVAFPSSAPVRERHGFARSWCKGPAGFTKY